MFIESPTILRLATNDQSLLGRLRTALTYTDKAASYEFKRFKKNRWFSQQHGQKAYDERLAELKAKVTVCLLKEDEDGYYTYSGLKHIVEATVGEPIVNNLSYPESKLLPVANKPEHKPRYYQTDSVVALLEARHAGVEVGTGLGKTLILEMLIAELGLQTVVMAPSKSIAGQIFKLLTNRFGPKYVGMYGDGKKKIDKLITVGIAASLTRVEKDSPAWEHFAKTKIFIADESHLCPAETLAHVCMGLMAESPYRFFFSGTQLRADGKDLLLDAITGPIVYSMDVARGVTEGFLAKPKFYMHRVPSKSNFMGEHMDMMQTHFYRNPDLNAYAADLINKSVELLGHQVLVLVEHVDQLQFLLPYLRVEVGFAHGGLTKANKPFVDPRFHDSDPDELVAQFNNGQLEVLIGTSCISTGTDIRPTNTIINLQGGQSEVKIRQAIGRGTRLVPGKTEFYYHDFYPVLPAECHINGYGEEDEEYKGLTSVERHSATRAEIFKSVFPPVQWIQNDS